MRIGFLQKWLRVHGVLAFASIGVWFAWQSWILVFYSIATMFTGEDRALFANSLQLLFWLFGVLLVLSLVTSCVVLLASKWRMPVLFMSYQNAHESLADQLKQDFEALGHTVHKLGFVPGRAHDETVSAVRQMIAKCDAVIAVPADMPSFMDSELARAETMGKGIIIARHLEDQRMIGAIHEGYPQFALDRLRAEPSALSAFLCWASLYWRTAVEQPRSGFESGVKWFTAMLFFCAISLAISVVFGVVIGGLIYVFSGSPIVFSMLQGHLGELAMTLICYPLVAFFSNWQFAMSQQIKTHGLVHQTFLSGAMTEKLLHDACQSSLRMKNALAALRPRDAGI